MGEKSSPKSLSSTLHSVMHLPHVLSTICNLRHYDMHFFLGVQGVVQRLRLDVLKMEIARSLSRFPFFSVHQQQASLVIHRDLTGSSLLRFELYVRRYILGKLASGSLPLG